MERNDQQHRDRAQPIDVGAVNGCVRWTGLGNHLWATYDFNSVARFQAWKQAELDGQVCPEPAQVAKIPYGRCFEVLQLGGPGRREFPKYHIVHGGQVGQEQACKTPAERNKAGRP